MEDNENNNNQTDRISFDDADNEDYLIRSPKTTRKLTPFQKRVPLFVVIISSFGLAVIIFAFIMEAVSNKEEADYTGDVVSSLTELQKDIDRLRWIDQDLLPVNRFSRPGTTLETINGIVIHNIGNPGTTAQQNRNYFANVVPAEEIFASSHFIICLDGSVIQCVPVNEIAYASNARNADTLSIEVCHPDATGEFTDESYETAVRLAAWLCFKYGLNSEDIIRHYDVERDGGWQKECPKYFVDNEDAWVRFKKDVQNAIDDR